MEIKKSVSSISIQSSTENQQVQNNAAKVQEPIWQASEMGYPSLMGLDLNGTQPSSATVSEEEASDILSKLEDKAAKENRSLNIFDIDNAVKKAKTEKKGNFESKIGYPLLGATFLQEMTLAQEKTTEISTTELLKQSEISISYLSKLSEAGIPLTENQKSLLKNMRALISKLQKRKITVKEFQEQKQQLLTDKAIKEQAEFIPKDTKKLTEEQLEQTKNLYTETGKTDIVLTQVAQEHAADQQQKQEIEIVFVAKAPIFRKEMVEKAIPKTLDDESTEQYIKSSEPLEIIERCYAAAIVEEADYLSEEEKEEKLAVIGRNTEEIKEIAQKNTERLTAQIIEARKEEQLQEFQANKSAKIQLQENMKEEHKIINNQQLKLDNKENRFQQMIAHLLEVIKNAKSKDKSDKKSQAKAEQAKYMKSRLDDKLAAIQSQKRLLKNEIEMNERYTALNIMSMEDDYIRNSSSLLVNV